MSTTKEISKELELHSVRVLMALAQLRAPVSKQKLMKDTGYAYQTVWLALYGNGTTYHGLDYFELITETKQDVDGLVEIAHQITPLGRAVLAEFDPDFLPSARTEGRGKRVSK